MKIGILTAFHDRVDVYKIYLENLNHLIRRIEHSVRFEVSIQVFIQTPVLEAQQLGRKHGHEVFHFEQNEPYGLKKNVLAKIALAYNCDYYLTLAEDHLINAQLLSAYLFSMEKEYEFIGILDGYFFDLMNHQLIYWPGYVNKRSGEPNGGWKCFSHGLLSRMGGEYVDPITRNMDQSSWTRILKHKPSIDVLKCYGHERIALDLKTENSLTKMDKLIKGGATPISKSVAFKRLPPRVVQFMRGYRDLIKMKSS